MFTFVLAAMLALTLEAGIAHAATFTVTNTNNSGSGSLRAVINGANTNGNPAEVDNINFNIQSGCASGGGVCTISPTSALPAISQPVVIDGYSQSGASANTLATGNNAVLKIVLNGTNAGSGAIGIAINSPDSVVRGLVINGWNGNGVEVEGSDATGNRIEGNFIGTDETGTLDVGNSGSGVVIRSADNFIGGTSVATRNILSGNNNDGVFVIDVDASGNSVQGNYIGTDASGEIDLGNGSDGVDIADAPDNLVGGTSAAARNIISNNDNEGVFVNGSDASGNTVQGNYIGTDTSGTEPLGNGSDGVEIDDAPNNLVGGTAAGARNVLSSNARSGVYVNELDASGNRIEGNAIGTDGSGEVDLGNLDAGVLIIDAPDNVVGGTSAAAGNIISNSSDEGVDVSGSAATNNSILRNSISDNGELGIDLLSDDENPSGVTANDPQDPDLGPNLLQNFPVITSATTPNGRSVSVQGTLNSNPNEAFTIQFFSSPTRDPSGYGEGKTYLGQTNVTANAGGNASFSFSANAPVLAGEFVTATATNSQTGDTSEFSRAVGVQDDTRPTVVSTNPQNGATGVPARADVFAMFSEAMNPSTINTNTFKLFKEVGNTQTLVPATVSYNEEARRGRLDPNANLIAGATYVATVTDRARDLAGNQLDQDPSTPGNQSKVWRFTVAR